MKKLWLILAALMPLALNAQTSANEVLTRFADKMKTLKSVAIDFDYTYDNSVDKVHETQQGSLLTAGKMYRLDWESSTIYCNGELRWTYLKSENEVTINNANVLADGVFANPSLLFSFDAKDYVCKLRHSKKDKGRTLLEIDLFPRNPKTDYTNINLRIDEATMLPARVMYYSRGGGCVTVYVRKLDTTPRTLPKDFNFDPKKHRNVEVVDLR